MAVDWQNPVKLCKLHVDTEFQKKKVLFSLPDFLDIWILSSSEGLTIRIRLIDKTECYLVLFITDLITDKFQILEILYNGKAVRWSWGISSVTLGWETFLVLSIFSAWTYLYARAGNFYLAKSRTNKKQPFERSLVYIKF